MVSGTDFMPGYQLCEGELVSSLPADFFIKMHLVFQIC
jgi:hypothetical protein